MNYNDFDKCLRKGEIGEVFLSKRFKEIFNVKLQEYKYEIFPELQKAGMNGKIIIDERYDIKVRDYKYYGDKKILLENLSVVEYNTRGWLWTSSADIIIYAWANKSWTKLIDCYILQLEKVRDWFKTVMENYKLYYAKSNRDGDIWTTNFWLVSINDIPFDCIKHFTPKIMLESEQKTISMLFEAPTNKPLFSEQSRLQIGF